MDKFKEKILRTKEISIWGIGYLGYTKILKLQSKGFRANVFDITEAGFKEKSSKNDYPDKIMVFRWSESGSVPPLEQSKMRIVNIDEMFSSHVHIFAFPIKYKGKSNYLEKMAQLFIDNKDKLDNPLVIFQSAATPGTIDHYFIGPLQKNKVRCCIATAFRSDWSVEEFFMQDRIRVLSGRDEESRKKVEFFYDLLETKYRTLSSIKEAEIYESARNGLQYATTVFINQLALAYQETNIRSMTGYLLEDIKLNESHLCIGAGGYKMPYFIQSILDGSQHPAALSLIQEVHRINLSIIITYAEAIKNRGIKSVAILGLSVKGNQKNIDFSPSVILAEHFTASGITVYIDDPFYDEKELTEILPGCKKIDIFKDSPDVGALFVMNDHSKFKYITQEDLDRLNLNKIPLIIDNVSLFKNFRFSHSTIYHAIGSGNVSLL